VQLTGFKDQEKLCFFKNKLNPAGFWVL